jgi:hypothetical protein
MEYCGTIRISNPKTLQSWIDRGWYQKSLSEGYIFNVGCGRFKTENVPAQLVELEKTRSKIVNKFNNLNINNMENGLNFGKPLRLLRQAKEWQEQDGTEQECSHT